MNHAVAARILVSCLAISCEDKDAGRDPRFVHGEVAAQCTGPTYDPPVDAGSVNDVALELSDGMQQDFALQALCLRVDGAVLVLTNAAELSAGRDVAGRVKLSPGPHEMVVLGRWKGLTEITRNYTFEVKSSHTFDASKTQKLHIIAYEAQAGPVQDRPKIEWREDPVVGPPGRP